MGTGPDVDVVVVGDGPAGSALAAACRRAGSATLLVGRGDEWTATYGTWRDDVADLPDHVFRAVSPTVSVWGHRHHTLDRAYAVVDNVALRRYLLDGVEQQTGEATGVQHFAWGSRVLTTHGPVDARRVVDATGSGALLPPPRPGRPPAYQTAFGVEVPELPPHLTSPGASVTLMDYRPPGATSAGATPSFCYVLPAGSGSGWLVEETVLAGRPAVDPRELRRRLVARLGHGGRDAVEGALRHEVVRIPMGGRLPPRDQQVVAFGAAAGYVHPATGYSVAASLRAAPRVAAALAGDGDPWAAVWPADHRRARGLHDFGLAALLRLDGAGMRSFFDAFFDLPVPAWSEYLRIDTTPSAVAAVMRSVFRASPWRVRRRLMAGDPRPLAQLFAR